MGAGNSRQQFLERAKVVTEGDPPRSAEFWVSLWLGGATRDDIFEALSPEAVRRMRRERPKNLHMLLVHAAEELRTRVGGPSAVFACVDVLTRVMPFVVEPSDDGGDDFLAKYVWPSGGETAADAGATKRPLGAQLLRGLLDLLFVPGLTVSGAARVVNTEREVVPPATHAWAAGVGVASVEGVAAGRWAPGAGGLCDVRRAAVLRCVAACCCGDVFRPPSAICTGSGDRLRTPSAQFLAYLTAAAPAEVLPHAPALLFSLLNVVCAYDPVGWGLPYNHVLSSQVPEDLVQTCLQLLLVLLSWRHEEILPPLPPPGAAAAAAAAEQPQQHPNVFIELVRNIRTHEQFRFVLNGLTRIVTSAVDATQTFLPFSKHGMTCFREALAVLWMVCLHNREFVSYIMLFDDLGKLLIPLLYFVHEGRSNPAHAGLVHLCSLTLLVLSEEREFGVSLNRPAPAWLPFPLPSLPQTGATLADVLVFILHKVFSEGDAGDALSECFLTVLANSSPYIKTLTMPAASKLLSVFGRVTKPRFLAKAERNPLFVYLALDVFNNAIQYEYEGNLPLIYTLLRCKNTFSRLASLTFEQFTKEAAQQPQPQEQPAAAKPTFVPTQAWFDAWKLQLPLGTVLRTIAILTPQIQAVCSGTADDDSAILAFLQRTTLVGLLPVPQPIVMRKYSHNAATARWFMTYVWSIVTARLTHPSIFLGAKIRLFAFGHQQQVQQTATAAQASAAAAAAATATATKPAETAAPAPAAAAAEEAEEKHETLETEPTAEAPEAEEEEEEEEEGEEEEEIEEEEGEEEEEEEEEVVEEEEEVPAEEEEEEEKEEEGKQQ